jgi:hypothetical protein
VKAIFICYFAKVNQIAIDFEGWIARASIQKRAAAKGLLLSPLSPWLKQSLVMVTSLDGGLVWTFCVIGSRLSFFGMSPGTDKIAEILVAIFFICLNINCFR